MRTFFVMLSILICFTSFSQPNITSFSPATGPVGTIVTITGTNLDNPTALSIGAVAAIVVSKTNTQIVGMVMPGAVTGAVSVTTALGTASAAGNFTVTSTPFPLVQQGVKLVGTGSVGIANQGKSVAVSSDGNTAIVGGTNDNSSAGAAWVYTRSGGAWAQQGAKLVGTGATGTTAQQGTSVSISSDGNTAIVGGQGDNSYAGAVWIFTRSGGVWTQQGAKLVGTGAVGAAQQGYSVSISADGNTAIVGGYADNLNAGAVWIYTRSGGVWTQQGVKLVGTGAAGAANQGYAVSISANGNTAIVGGRLDNSNAGAVWVFTRSGGVWTQQGAKLMGTGAVGFAQQGYAVSISSDGNTAIIGGSRDNSDAGAAWLFTRSGGVWTQQGTKLVGTSTTGAYAQQGYSVSISADGNTAMVGGARDNSNAGAAWIYTRSGGVWTQQGAKLVGTGAVGTIAQQGTSVSISSDGNTAIVGGYYDNSGAGAAWIYIAPPTLTSFTPTSATTGSTVTITGTKFTGATAVSFGGTAATSFTVVNSTTITAVVAAGSTGSVSVTTPASTVTLAGFTFIAAPTITSFSPASGPVGTLVTITGTNLGNPGAISIGGATAIEVSKTNTQRVAMIMPGAVTGAVSVNTAFGTATAAGNFTVTPTLFPNVQQGAKLVGTGAAGNVGQGGSVSISADGNTAIVGCKTNSITTDAAWVYTRSGRVWTQQGTKLACPGATGGGSVGSSVAISSDGNTAIIGGYGDNSNAGGVWIYTRSGGVWTQQGAKMLGTGAVGKAIQGYALSISADGNTAIVGGTGDNSNAGAVWIYTRSDGVWTQQGAKLVGTGAVGVAHQGNSVSISADGNTAIVGGSQDNSAAGAVWIYTRSGGVWTQQGAKLVGTGATVGYVQQGTSVSISADGNTAIVGGHGDNSYVGAVWIYTRSGGVWTQQGAKLVGTGAVGAAYQGSSVSTSADGNVAFVGGSKVNSNDGAAWVYTRSNGVWAQQGSKLVGTGAVGSAWQGESVSLSSDGNTAILGGSLDNSNAGAAWVYIAGPNITSFTPTSAANRSTVTITGTNLTGATAVSFGGTAAYSFTVNNATTITAVVAAGSSGSVSVTTPDGTNSLPGFTFIPTPPSISSFSPAVICSTGTTVTVRGLNFTSANAITLNGATSQFNLLSDTVITFVTGTVNNSGLIAVTTPYGTATSANTIIIGTGIPSFLPNPSPFQLCAGSPRLLNTNLAGAYNYVCSNGQSGNAITINSIGNYTLTATDEYGCSNSTSFSVTNYSNCGGYLEIESEPVFNYFDTLTVRIKIKNGVNIFSTFAYLNFNPSQLKYVSSTPGNYLGANVLIQPPVITGGQIDFGMSHISGDPGTYGDGLIYEFKFVLADQIPNLASFNAVKPNAFTSNLTLTNLSIYNAVGVQPPSFAAISMLTKPVACRYYVPVWPGDLNFDRKVNVADITPIGYFYGIAGPVRPDASLGWVAQPSQLWGFDKTKKNSSAYTTFADGTPDGIINLADQTSIGFNLNKFRLNEAETYTPPVWHTDPNLPPLAVAMPSTQIPIASLPVNEVATITLGSQAFPLNNLYGVAFDVFFDPAFVNTAAITSDFSNTIFGTQGVNYTKIEDKSGIASGRFSIGITRFNTTGINATGGTVMKITFPLKAGGAQGLFKVTAIPLTCNDPVGNELAITGGQDSLMVGSLSACTTNNWVGTVSTAWENAGNWSCGAIPGPTTVVNIPAATSYQPVIRSAATCKKLNAAPGANIKVDPGFKLDIIGP